MTQFTRISAACCVALAISFACGACDCGFEDPAVDIDEADAPFYVALWCDVGTAAYGCECIGKYRPFEMCETLANHWVADALANGLTYDQTCMNHLWQTNLDFERAHRGVCSATAADNLAWLACEQECQIYHGEGALGEACERFGRRMSTCRGDLVCGFDDVCHAPCSRPLEVPEGGPCGYALGLLHESCAAGFTCHPVDAVCVPTLAPGASCDPVAPLCAPAELCPPGTGVCEPLRALGEPCDEHEQCASLVCDDVCAPPDVYRCAHPWF